MKKIKTLLINHKDSFTRNVESWLSLGGCDVDVSDNSSFGLLENYDLLVLGPGPGCPGDWQKSIDLIDSWGNRPMLGICLGCQLITHYLGGIVEANGNPCHGENVKMFHQDDFFTEYDSPLLVPRYNSLMIRNPIPDELIPIGFSEENKVLALKGKDLPWAGFLFHPDSFLSNVKFNSRWFFK